MNWFPEMQVSGSGLTAERTRLEVIASNIANVNTTQTPEGGVFRRQIVQLMSMENSDDPAAAGVQVAGIVPDPAPLQTVFDPDNPAADEQGYVAKPNINIMMEMVDMLGASRSYEANVTVLQSAKDMARLALEL